jgi:hypothetical protein
MKHETEYRERCDEQNKNKVKTRTLCKTKTQRVRPQFKSPVHLPN